MRIILAIINFVTLIGAIIWWVTAPDWEPAVTSIGLFGALLAQVFTSEEIKSKEGSHNYQAAGNQTITDNKKIKEIKGDYVKGDKIANNTTIDLRNSFIGNVNFDYSKDIAQAIKSLDEKYIEILRSKDHLIKNLEYNLRTYREAITTLPETEASSQTIFEALHEIKAGDLKKAKNIFIDIEKKKSQMGESANRQAAEAARYLGDLEFFDNPQEANESYRRATILDPENVFGWNGLGRIQLFVGELDNALSSFKKSIEFGTRASIGDQILQAIANGNIGYIYSQQGSLDKAEEMYVKALEIEIALDREEGIAVLYGNLGMLYFERNQLDVAKEYFSKSLDIYINIFQYEGIISQYNNLSLLYLKQGYFDKAEKMCWKSLEVTKARGNIEEEANLYGNLGYLFQIQGNLIEAEKMFKESLDIYQGLKLNKDVAAVCAMLGSIYQTKGDVDKAKEMFNKGTACFSN